MQSSLLLPSLSVWLCGVSSSLLMLYSYRLWCCTSPVLLRLSLGTNLVFLSDCADPVLLRLSLDCLNIVLNSVVHFSISTGYEPGVIAPQTSILAPIAPAPAFVVLPPQACCFSYTEVTSLSGTPLLLAIQESLHTQCRPHSPCLPFPNSMAPTGLLGRWV